MASHDYETEKVVFRDFYEASRDTMEAARNAFLTLVRLLLATDPAIAGAKVEGRIKEREECLSKFRLKYQTGLESSKTPYAIRDHISDLIGLRIVCFYEDDLETVLATKGEALKPIVARIDTGVDYDAFLERFVIEFGPSAEDLQVAVLASLKDKGCPRAQFSAPLAQMRCE